MSDDLSYDKGHPKPRRRSCLIAFLLVSALMLLAIGSVLYFLNMAFTGFEFHRDKICLRRDLTIKDKNLWYSPAMDAVMWCRVTVEAKNIDDVFDTNKVDTTQFTEVGYKIRHSTPITDHWWDADEKRLIGGEVEVETNKVFMRVGYIHNGDGTLTVYILWFEV